MSCEIVTEQTIDEFEPYHDLADAIVASAVEDYRKALKTYQRTRSYEVYAMIRRLERFFRSQWCDELLRERLSGEDVMRIVREDLGVKDADI